LTSGSRRPGGKGFTKSCSPASFPPFPSSTNPIILEQSSGVQSELRPRPCCLLVHPTVTGIRSSRVRSWLFQPLANQFAPAGQHGCADRSTSTSRGSARWSSRQRFKPIVRTACIQESPAPRARPENSELNGEKRREQKPGPPNATGRKQGVSCQGLPCTPSPPTAAGSPVRPVGQPLYREQRAWVWQPDSSIMSEKCPYHTPGVIDTLGSRA